MRFPYFASGKVVKGFGRGSKQLKIPTANFSEEIVEQLPQEYIEGVYFGWARVNNGGTFKMVMSIGKNPYFNNTRRTMETKSELIFKNLYTHENSFTNRSYNKNLPQQQIDF